MFYKRKNINKDASAGGRGKMKKILFNKNERKENKSEGSRFIYEKIDEEKIAKLKTLADLKKLFHMLMMRLGGKADRVLKTMEDLKQRGYIDKKINLQEFERQLQEDGVIREVEGRNSLTRKGNFKIRETAFQEIFAKMKRGSMGRHILSKTGKNPSSFDLSVEKRKYEFGDDTLAIDFCHSFFNSISRSASLEMDLKEDDLEVFEKEQGTDVAIALMIDISHSMILYGEDRITPAKELALALAHIITTQYPRDDLSVVLFGDDAVRVEVKDLATINVGPYHTNTQMGLRKAREILAKKKQSNKQIIMITDGKPSMIKLSDGSYYKNAFGLDPEIVSRTLDEAMLCRKKNIPITTFMITEDEVLQEFVQNLTRANKGKAFYCNLDNLGSFVIENFMNNKRKNIR